MRVLTVLVCVVLGPAGMAAADVKAALPRALARLTDGATLKVVCLGDSVTGLYYHTGGRRAYTDMIAFAVRAALPGAKLDMVNAGISGNSTRDALARLERDVLSQRPHLVTVMFGLNDMVRVPHDQFHDNLGTIIRKCRAIGAEVLLCTPNGVIDTAGRPTSKLIEYCDTIRSVAREEKVPLCDCYAAYSALQTKDAKAWRLLLSDEIHPNMDGHKLIAEEIGRSITGKSVSLRDVGPPQPAIPRTLRLLKAGEPVRVLAMPPYDSLIAGALRKIENSARVEVTPWPTDGQTLPQIEVDAKKVRSKKVDLVLVAVPASATAESAEQAIRSYTWVLNWSLSFGKQEWDVVAITPSVAKPELTAKEEEMDELARRLIRAQDLSAIVRHPGDDASAAQILVRWLREEVARSLRPGK
jgi:lysophospholipase L1-like esterase